MQLKSPSSNSMNKEILQAARFDIEVLDSDDSWDLLLYKEAYYITRLTIIEQWLKISVQNYIFSHEYIAFVSFFHVSI